MKRNHNTNISDSFRIKHIEMPKMQIPKSEYGPRSNDYWKIYNKGVFFFNKNKYEEAKEEFVKLHKQEPLHKALYSYLSKASRYIIEDKVKQNKYKESYVLYLEFFDICKDNITTADKRKYNKLIEKLEQIFPGQDYIKIDSPKLQRKDEFEIIDPTQNRIKFIEQTDVNDKADYTKGNWSFIEPVTDGYIYVKTVYDADLSKCNRSFVRKTDKLGNVLNNTVLNHGAYRFKASENSGKYVVSSEDLIFYLYTMHNRCLATYKLRNHADDKHHIRCIDISPDGEYLLFTHIDNVYLMDSHLKIIGNWQMPLKEGWEKRTMDGSAKPPSDNIKYLSILGLHGKPTDEEIKKAFRNLVLKYHPDVNPDDPRATEKTRDIILAYESLTGDNAKQAFKEFENADYYYTVIDRIKIEIPGSTITSVIEFGMVGPGEDWIYATLLDSNADKIYIGCYSGKVYLVLKDGRILKVYYCWDVIRQIKLRKEYLLVATDNTLYIIKNDQYVTHIDISNSKLKWCDEGVMLFRTQGLCLYTYDGNKLCDVSFKKSIHDAFWTSKNLKIMTINKIFSFLVS